MMHACMQDTYYKLYIAITTLDLKDLANWPAKVTCIAIATHACMLGV